MSRICQLLTQKTPLLGETDLVKTLVKCIRLALGQKQALICLVLLAWDTRP